jgi:hypothetical protein
VKASEVLGCYRAVCERIVRKGVHGITPPGQATPEGVQHTRRLETTPHGALRSGEAYPSQRSSRQGCYHTDMPAISSRSSDLPIKNIMSRPRLLSRDQPALAGALAHDSLRVAKRREGYDSGGDGRRSRPVRVFGRPFDGIAGQLL